ncbi:MAG: hypothetical protein ISR58_17725 [Anaerolineales bacterium]|nr:hypothetical protein [Anaerolineales bacterium]
MLQTNIPIPANILAALDALAELGQAITEHQKQQTTDSDNPGRETLSAAERQTPTTAEASHD